MSTANLDSFLNTVCLIEAETLYFFITQKLIAQFYQSWVKLYVYTLLKLDLFLTTKRYLSDGEPSYVPIFNLFLQPV